MPNPGISRGNRLVPRSVGLCRGAIKGYFSKFIALAVVGLGLKESRKIGG